jgi:phosphohistidine phosphatase
VRELFVWRHAKAVPAERGTSDRERALSQRGERDARRVARWLAPRAAGALLLCSTARRTRETAGALCDLLGSELDIRFESALYLASAARLRAQLRALPDEIPCAVLIGHNPGLHDLVRVLVAGARRPGDAWLDERFPTAALAQLRFRARRWRDLAPGRGELVAAVEPAELLRLTRRRSRET